MAYLIIETPNTQLSEASSIARLNTLQMNGNRSKKIFTIECIGSPFTTSSTMITLSQGGSGSAFSLFPSVGGTSCDFIIVAGSKASFSVDYDASLGTGVTASIIASSTIFGGLSASYTVLSPTVPISLSVYNPLVNTKRDIGPLLSVDEDGDYIVQQATSKITQDETSFGIIRTNPKLSGNVKITIDSTQDIWLNSIDAEKELSDDRFKKYRISPNSSYAIDINRFFDYGKMPSEIVYSLYQADTQYTSTKRSYAEQYDRFYQYGVTQLNSKFYDEEFSFFAPLYLKTEVPEYFVIFRTTGPINQFSYDVPFADWGSYVTTDILKTSKIIKTFSLSDSTSIGKYLRNIVDHPARRESDITVSYQKNGYTTFNGISYEKGTFAQMGELLYEYVNQENPLTNVEEFTTLGFQRNKVVSSHIMNLEFLFDDPTAESYSINRYFGLYVNTIDLAKFDLSAEALEKFSLPLGQLPLPRKGIDGTKISQKAFIQTNPNGVSIFADNTSIIRIPDEDPLKLYSSKVSLITLNIGTFDTVFPGNFTQFLNVGDTVTFSSGGLFATAKILSFTYDLENTTLTFDTSTFTSTISISLFSLNTWTANFYTAEKYEEFKPKVFDNVFVDGTSRMLYVKDHNNDLHSVDYTLSKDVYIDPFTPKNVTQITLKDTEADITQFAGFSTLLTQADAKLLNTRGRSSLSIELKDYFSANDFIEIRWEPGPTGLGYPLRWKVVANDSNLNPGENWPSYTLANDIEGDYYLSYFHSGDSTIELPVFAKSIENAFNQFPFKDFEVLAKGNFLHFRSTQDGLASEAAKLTFSTYVPSIIKIMGIDTDTNLSVNFIGGTNRTKTRARIDNTIAEGMRIDEYVSTKGSFSLAKPYSVANQTIIFSPYLEEPVYDEAGEKLIDFIDSDKYYILSLKDEKTEIQLTSDDRITTYELFNPTYGVLSVLPLRDFDTDFYSSEYSRDHTPELIEYFGRAFPSAIVTNQSGLIYTFDQLFSFDSYPVTVPFLQLSTNGTDEPKFFNTQGQFLFTGPGMTATLLCTTFIPSEFPTVGSNILLLPNEKSLYFSEGELSKFKGFLSLSGIVTASDEALFKELENLWDPKRFLAQKLNSEYDRMAENYLKTLVLLSRVVPYSMKWVSPQGKDVRENPYRLNYHRVFGNMSFTPSAEIQTPEPSYHTHEWPYLDSIPDKFPIAEFPANTFGYMFETLTPRYDFSSLKRDWFSQYFSTGFPVEKYKNANGDYESVKVDATEKYSYFNYEDFSDKTFSFFRGYRFQITELSELTGNSILNSKKYDNYRFSVVMKMEEENPFVNEDPIVYTMTVNEKWKFIALVITVRTSSYRFPLGKLSYVDLYTLQNNNDSSTYEYDPSYGYTLTGFRTAIPTDKKLSQALNLQYYSTRVELISTFNYFDTFANSTSFVDYFTGEILPLPDGSYSDIVTFNSALAFNMTTNIPKVTEIIDPNNLNDVNTVKLSSGVGNISYDAIPLALTLNLPYLSMNWQDHVFYHQLGGNDSLKEIAERTSFFEIVNVINGTSQKSTMNYVIYKEDGSVLNTNNFLIEPISPEKLTRIFDYFPTSDTDKPAAFFTSEHIGVVLNETKDLQSLYRYQGDFSPKFTDVLKFWVREDEDFTVIANKDFLLNNTHFAPELTDFSIIRNQFFTKIADTEILTLSPASGYKPVYPLINEIAIDKQHLFAWSSSWDQNYYKKYNSTSEFQEIKGTDEMKEVKSVFGSKAMKLPNQYDLFEFTTKKVIPKKKSKKTSTETELADELNKGSAELTYHEDANGVTAVLQIDVYSRLLREMMGTSTDLRAKEEFMKAMNLIPASFTNTELEQRVREYLIDNVLDLYEISEAKLFVLSTGNAAKGKIQTLKKPILEVLPRPLIQTVPLIGVGDMSLSEAELLNKKYVKNKDTKIVSQGNLKFQVIYSLDSRFYTSLSIGVAVKRI